MKPEYRLPLLWPGAITVPLGLFLYGWTAQYKVHWIVPILGTALLGAGVSFPQRRDLYREDQVSVHSWDVARSTFLGLLAFSGITETVFDVFADDRGFHANRHVLLV